MKILKTRENFINEVASQIQQEEQIDVQSLKSNELYLATKKLLDNATVGTNKILSKYVDIIGKNFTKNNIKFDIFSDILSINGDNGMFITTDKGDLYVSYSIESGATVAYFSQSQNKLLTGDVVPNILLKSRETGIKVLFDQIVDIMAGSDTVTESVINEAGEIEARISSVTKDVIDQIKSDLSAGFKISTIAEKLVNAGVAPWSGLPKHIIYADLQKMQKANMLNTESITISTKSTDEIIKRYKDSVIAQRKKFDENLEQIKMSVVSMSNIIKNPGQELVGPRVVIISGIGGVGKTFTILKTLKEEGLVEHKDFLYKKSVSTAMSSLYGMFYKYKDKLLILDDCVGLFDSADVLGFWKSVGGADGMVDSKAANIFSGRESNYYEKTSNRQTNFYNEIGFGTKIVKTSDKYKNLQRKLKSIQNEIESFESISVPTDRQTQKLANLLMQRNDINKDMNDMTASAEGTKSKIPSRFEFKGCAIVITNMSFKMIKQDIETLGGAYEWGAVKSRVSIIEVSPEYQITWYSISDKLKEMIAEGKSYKGVIKPTDMQAIIDYVNKIFTEQPDIYNTCSWRMLDNVCAAMLQKPGDTNWWQRAIRSALSSSGDGSTLSEVEANKYLKNAGFIAI